MFPVPARVYRAVSRRRVEPFYTLKRDPPQGRIAKPVLGARPAAQEPRENANDDGRSEEHPVTVPGVQH